MNALPIEPIDAKIKLSLSSSNTTLNAYVTIEYIPFDFRKYEFNSDSTYDKLNWISAILYNYIPFALCKSDNPGNYNSFDNCQFSPVDISSQITDFETSHELKKPKVDLMVFDLQDLADDTLYPNQSWYLTEIGKQFAFNYGFDGSLFFDKDSDIEGFGSLMETIKEDPESSEYTANLNLDIEKDELNKVIFHMSVDISGLTDEYTYALVSVNPASKETFTEFLAVGKKEETKTYHFRCNPDSIVYIDRSDKTVMSDKSIEEQKISINIKQEDVSKNWEYVKPRISFKVEKYYE